MPFSAFIRTAGLSTLLFIFSIEAMAQLRVAEVFSSNMVLQRDKPVPVWGTATSGKEVKVIFAGQQVAAQADAQGKWKVQLKPLALSAQPQDMQIIGESTITLQNILVGDVWLCSGQSNMEYTMDRNRKRFAPPGKGPDVSVEELNNNAKPGAVRYLLVEKNLNKYPALPTKGWITAQDSTLRDISAIGYYFAKAVHEATKVPIGIISDAWGGTFVEQWTPPEAYAQSSTFKPLMTSDTFRINGMKPGQMYKGMIEPLLPYAIKGVLWYQGESNCIIEDQATYMEKMRVFENHWRQVFLDPQLPFYTVQIAPFIYSTRNDVPVKSAELLPQFWEAQTRCMQLSNTYMVVTTDLVDNLKDIHPSYKWTIGQRMATQALHYTYNHSPNTGNHPQYAGMKRKGNSIRLKFDYAGNGLKSSDGKPLTWFSIAGEDGRFVPATAEIEGNQVKVFAPDVSKPTQVRFAWHETAMPNLVSAEGLPCIPFRTDGKKK